MLFLLIIDIVFLNDVKELRHFNRNHLGKLVLKVFEGSMILPCIKRDSKDNAVKDVGRDVNGKWRQLLLRFELL